MKKSLFLIALTVISMMAFAQSENQRSYRHAIGGRLAYSNIDFMAGSYKNFFTRKSAFEVNLGWGFDIEYNNKHHSFSLNPGYQFHFPIGNTGLAPFIGGGGIFVARTFSRTFYAGMREVNEGRFGAGFFTVLGIDYKSRKNFNIAVDVRPSWIYYGTDYVSDPIYAGISLRRTF